MVVVGLVDTVIGVGGVCGGGAVVGLEQMKS